MTIDYTKLSERAFLDEVGLDASKWVEAAFCQIAQNLGHNIEPDGWMASWFANAIEQARAHEARITVAYLKANNLSDPDDGYFWEEPEDAIAV